MQKDLENMNKWCDDNKMKINENKTNCMFISTKQKLSKLPKSTLDLSINDVTLVNVEKQKLLGVEIDSYLTLYNASC